MIRHILLTLTLFLFLANATVSSEPSEIIIPMDLSLNRPVIELFINQSGPYRFIFDTGASVCVIDQDLASRLNLPETGKVDIRAPGAETASSVPQVVVSEIEVSGRTWTDINMMAIPLRQMIPVDGILSYKVFAEHLVHIHYPEKKIILTKGNLSEDEDVVALIPDCEILTVPIQTKNRIWHAHLDTGAPFSFAFPFALKDELKFKSPPAPLAQQSRTISGTHKNWTAQLDESIKLAGIIYPAPDIILSEMNRETVNIGYQLLKNLLITIDQQNGLIRFQKIEAKDIEEEGTSENDNAGMTGRYGGVRRITLENGIYYIQRDGSIKLKLEKVGDNLYEGRLPEGLRAMNVLPKIRFEWDDNQQVIGLTFVHPDGREEFVKKDMVP